MTEAKTDTREHIVINRHQLARGVLIALIAVLLSGVAFAAGVGFGRANPYETGFARHPMISFTGRRVTRPWLTGIRATYGSVKSFGTNQFDFTTNGGTTLTVTLTDNSVILNQGSVVSLSSLKVGDEVAVFGETSGTAVTATRVVINPRVKQVG